MKLSIIRVASLLKSGICVIMYLFFAVCLERRLFVDFVLLCGTDTSVGPCLTAGLSSAVLVPATLQQLCRTHIRRVLRARLLAARPPPPPTARAQRRRSRPVGRRAEQARRIQRFVMPLLGAAVTEVNDSEPEGEQPSDEEGEQRADPLRPDGERRQDREGRAEEARDSDHSEEAYMELAGSPVAELETTRSPQREPEQQQEEQQEEQPEQEQQEGSRADSQQQQQDAPADGSPLPEAAAQTRTSLKRSSEESSPGAPDGLAAGAGPSDSQKRGRRDKFDSGMGESPPPPPLPPRPHAEPENGVAANSDEEEDDEEDDGDDDDDDDDEAGADAAGGRVGGGRRLLLLPPPSRWGGRSARFGAEFATELSRFLTAGSEEEDELDDELERGEAERRARCPYERRRRARPGRHAAADAGRRLADDLRAQIAALPLPPPLRQYVNLGRPL